MLYERVNVVTDTFSRIMDGLANITSTKMLLANYIHKLEVLMFI